MTVSPEVHKQNDPIMVQSCSIEEFQGLVESVQDSAQNIPINSWSEVPAGTPVLNRNAVPCLIIYVKTPLNFISGHFASTSNSLYRFLFKEYYDNLLRMYGEPDKNPISIPTDEQIKDLTQWGAVESQHGLMNYESMLARTKDILIADGKVNTYSYLFGQNLGWHFESYGEFMNQFRISTIDRFHVDTDLTHLGIPFSNVNDYRSQNLNLYYSGDDTIFIPDTNTIYHLRESHLSK